jgi:hypothetical protein
MTTKYKKVKEAFRSAPKHLHMLPDMALHHDGIPFAEIFNNFLTKKGLNIDDIELGGRPRARKYIKDKKLREEWVAYHNEHAHIRIINRKEHAKLHLEEEKDE